jgi:hypothetical protein
MGKLRRPVRTIKAITEQQHHAFLSRSRLHRRENIYPASNNNLWSDFFSFYASIGGHYIKMSNHALRSSDGR